MTGQRRWPKIINPKQDEQETARQLVSSMGCCEDDDDPVSAVYPNDSSVSAPELNQAVARSLAVSIGYPDDSSPPAPEAKPAPIHEPPEQRALFERM
jgi:hypothetical protein